MTTPPGAANDLDVSGDDGRPASPSSPPARPCDFAPAPRRSRVGLVAQFVLQFLYLPVWVLIAAGLVVLALWIDTSGPSPNLFPPSFVFQFSSVAISWRRLRVEWRGRAEDWEPFTDALLRRNFAAEENAGRLPSSVPPSGVRRLVVTVPVRHYRGLGGPDIERLAHRYGWSVDWNVRESPEIGLRLFRDVPPPEQVGVPDPYGPPAAPGAPWGPLPYRRAMPLLTFVFAPSLRILELRRDPDAYLAHLRAYLPRQFGLELKKSAIGQNYTADEAGRILRRVSIATWHFRGVGAQAVLRLAAEHGWQLDRGFPADPYSTVHLCRTDELFRSNLQKQLATLPDDIRDLIRTEPGSAAGPAGQQAPGAE